MAVLPVPANVPTRPGEGWRSGLSSIGNALSNIRAERTVRDTLRESGGDYGRVADALMAIGRPDLAQDFTRRHLAAEDRRLVREREAAAGERHAQNLRQQRSEAEALAGYRDRMIGVQEDQIAAADARAAAGDEAAAALQRQRDEAAMARLQMQLAARRREAEMSALAAAERPEDGWQEYAETTVSMVGPAAMEQLAKDALPEDFAALRESGACDRINVLEQFEGPKAIRPAQVAELMLIKRGCAPDAQAEGGPDTKSEFESLSGAVGEGEAGPDEAAAGGMIGPPAPRDLWRRRARPTGGYTLPGSGSWSLGDLLRGTPPGPGDLTGSLGGGHRLRPGGP